MLLRFDVGVTKTVQFGDYGKYGKLYTVDPWSTKTTRHEVTCFEAIGTKNWVLFAQSIIPDTTNFKVIHIRIFHISCPSYVLLFFGFCKMKNTIQVAQSIYI